MANHRPPRARNVRVLATLGPASATPERIRALHDAGADAFRVNMSHGDEAARGALIAAIRRVEADAHRPITVLADLQGPKLRIGAFAGDRVMLERGQRFRLDLSAEPGDSARVQLPHPEIIGALKPGHRLLLDDGKVALVVLTSGDGHLLTEVAVPGALSNRKGLNVPDALVPLPALTEKDRRDLSFALDAGADWIALSFVQRPEDVAEARKLIGGRAALMSKIEKPAALQSLDAIIELSDAVMVARGDLGVELPPQAVPVAQKRIIAAARAAGKPVVVATQMLESMITAPSPTRAEVSDVANALYDGADAVMLSAESAAGQWPVEAVAMMDAIAREVEADPLYTRRVNFVATPPERTTADAMCEAAREIQAITSAKAVVCFTMSGSSARRVARERIPAPLLILTPRAATARRLGLLWGSHAVHTRDVAGFEEMVGKAKRMALRHGLAAAGDRLVLIAGVPFGVPGSTNVVHVVRLAGDELEKHRAAR